MLNRLLNYCFLPCLIAAISFPAYSDDIYQQAIKQNDKVAQMDVMRAVYLYKMGFFIPNRDSREIIKIGVIGEDVISRLLATLGDQPGFEQRYEMFEFEHVEDYHAMHVIYFPGRFYTDQVMQQLLSHPLLIIGNDEFCWIRDYHICLFQHDDKLQFKVNVTQMKKSGLKISSKLLRLATQKR